MHARVPGYIKIYTYARTNANYKSPPPSLYLFVRPPPLRRMCRIESIIGTEVGFLIMTMLLQAGGVPSPTGVLGWFLWALWMGSVALQWVLILLAELLLVSTNTKL